MQKEDIINFIDSMKHNVIVILVNVSMRSHIVIILPSLHIGHVGPLPTNTLGALGYRNLTYIAHKDLVKYNYDFIVIQIYSSALKK